MFTTVPSVRGRIFPGMSSNCPDDLLNCTVLVSHDVWCTTKPIIHGSSSPASIQLPVFISGEERQRPCVCDGTNMSLRSIVYRSFCTSTIKRWKKWRQETDRILRDSTYFLPTRRCHTSPEWRGENTCRPRLCSSIRGSRGICLCKQARRVSSHSPL